MAIIISAPDGAGNAIAGNDVRRITGFATVAGGDVVADVGVGGGVGGGVGSTAFSVATFEEVTNEIVGRTDFDVVPAPKSK